MKKFISSLCHLCLFLALMLAPKNFYLKYSNSNWKMGTSGQELYAQNPPQNVTVKRGDNLSSIFDNNDFSREDLVLILNHPKAKRELTQLMPGETLSFFQGSSNQALDKLVYKKNPQEKITYYFDGDDINIIEKKFPLEKKVYRSEFYVDSAVYVDAKRAQIPMQVISQLVDIFSWDIDFALDIQKGDKIQVLFEEFYLKDQFIRAGDILKATITNRGEEKEAILWVEKMDNGKLKKSYFNPEGKSLQKAFLRSPVHFTRISSRFNLRRRHPILHHIRAHRGVDYSAPRGTPIKASGDGKIIHRGWKGGYGKTVVIKHGQGITTLYAHMSRYSRLKKNQYVRQGDIIGYVGKTGMATGNHLHYEFRIHGVHKNPLYIPLPNSKNIAEEKLAYFQDYVEEINNLDQKLYDEKLALNQ